MPQQVIRSAMALVDEANAAVRAIDVTEARIESAGPIDPPKERDERP